MQSGLGRDVIEMTVMVEFALIIFMILSTYFAKLSVMIVRKRREKLIATIEKHLTELINSRSSLDLKTFKRRWKKIQFLFPILLKFDKQYGTNAAWLNIRNDFLHGLLVPLARRRARSRRWLLRFYASETFALVYDKQDEPFLLRLLKDRIPLVYLHTIKTAIKSNSEAAINAVITRMSKMSWITQTMYLKPFEEASPQVRSYIETRLKSAKESAIRAECYKILRKFSPGAVSWDVSADLDAADFELRIAALKFMLHTDEKASLPILVNKLKDNRWEIRLVAIHRLSMLKAESALADIANCLNDADWRVKMGAAEALKSFGDKGSALLKERAPDLANIAFSAKEHLPGTLW